MIVVETVHLCHVEVTERSVVITAENRNGDPRRLELDLRFLRHAKPTYSEYESLDAVYLMDGTENILRLHLLRLTALRDRIDAYKATKAN